jgi:Holliday junction DNA helicase RuvA
MISFLRGTVARKTLVDIVLDVGGVGYICSMSSSGLSSIGDVGDEAIVHTYMQVSDAGVSLYGFAEPSELDAFKLLIAVNGVGPKMAIAVLSMYSADSLAAVIHAEDATALSKVPGVGKKMASRMILELKDKFASASFAGSIDGSADVPSTTVGGVIAGATEALLSMGFSSAEADIALKGAPDSSEAAALQYALKRLGS